MNVLKNILIVNGILLVIAILVCVFLFMMDARKAVQKAGKTACTVCENLTTA